MIIFCRSLNASHVIIRINSEKIITYYNSGLNETSIDLLNGMTIKVSTPSNEIDKQLGITQPEGFDTPILRPNLVQLS